MSLNFTSENVDVKQYISPDSKIQKITVNPITYHTTIEIENTSHAIEIIVMKEPGGGFNATIKDIGTRATMTNPFSSSASDVKTSLKMVLANWEKCFLERLERT